MIDYLQPDFYHFSQDSTLLAKIIYENKRGQSIGKLLDVCSGCGVIGIELSNLLEINELSLCEVQKEFLPYMNKNIENISKAQSTTVINQSVESLNIEKYDLISINPPYFSSRSSRPSPDKNKNICRLYEPGKLETILRASLKLLKREGELFFVIREDKYSLEEISKAFSNHYLEKLHQDNSLVIYRGTI